MSEENIQLLHEFAREVVAKDVEGLRRLMHDDVVVREAPTLPYGGDHRGPEGFVHVYETVQKLWEFTEEFKYTYIDAGPEKVLLMVEVGAIARATGRHVAMRLAEVFTLRDKKIAEIDVFYWDTAAMRDALESAGS
jgi:ketosteroid isomerase-like protein